MSAIAIARQRAVTWLREQGERLHLPVTGMSRKDAARWASARDLADLGELVVAWLNGEVAQTPGHCGPPCAETIPLIPALTLANRAGFITDCSQRAESKDGNTWNTWVDGFASEAVMQRLREVTAGTPLVMTACHGRCHECSRAEHLARCLRREVAGFWADCCPDAADDIYGCWFISIEDPEPGRNDLLWPALEAFAGLEAAP